jgi:hypothetical protein
MKHYFTYKTTNLKNGKCYIGVHSTTNLNDGYMGSGYKLQAAIKKYGKENFKTEPIQFFNSIEDAYKHEAELVNEIWVKSKNNYNTALGGLGGFYHIDTKGKNNPNYGKRWSCEWRVQQSNRMKEYYQLNKPTNLGRTFDDSWRENISKSRKERGSSKDDKNPNFGKGKVVLQYDKNGTIIKEWISAHTAAKYMRIGSENIYRCLQGKNKTAAGYIWKFKVD